MIVKYECADDLPAEWDLIVGDNIYLTREFISFMEGTDDHIKKYYGVFCGEKLDTVFETVEFDDFNLSMFSGRDKFVKITLVYVPLSVTQAGIAYNECLAEAAEFVRKIPGYKMFLNMPDVTLKGYAKGYTCPKCILDIKWETFDEYLDSLRSNYRYRYKKALKKSSHLTIRYLSDGSEFTSEMYSMYEQVYGKSRVRVEKLTERFFRGKCFKIFVMEEEGKPKGFVQLLENGSELVFEFVGVDYSANSECDTYIAMLLEIVRYGIENGFETIDFGQTADDAKLKLGSRHVYLYAFLNHSNPIINALCHIFAQKIQCKPMKQVFEVFKKENQI